MPLEKRGNGVPPVVAARKNPAPSKRSLLGGFSVSGGELVRKQTTFPKQHFVFAGYSKTY